MSLLQKCLKLFFSLERRIQMSNQVIANAQRAIPLGEEATDRNERSQEITTMAVVIREQSEELLRLHAYAKMLEEALERGHTDHGEHLAQDMALIKQIMENARKILAESKATHLKFKP